MIALTPRKEKFAQGVSFAKRLGCKFDLNRKVWLRSEEALWAFVDGSKRADQTRISYRRANGLEIAGTAAPDTTRPAAATTWMGAASMDAEDSIF